MTSKQYENIVPLGSQINLAKNTQKAFTLHSNKINYTLFCESLMQNQHLLKWTMRIYNFVRMHSHQIILHCHCICIFMKLFLLLSPDAETWTCMHTLMLSSIVCLLKPKFVLLLLMFLWN